jgi:inosine-uridine nucleoside N-ribohydrolase
VEARGELTRGMLVVDVRPQPAGPANARIATDVSVGEVRQYIDRTLKQAT